TLPTTGAAGLALLTATVANGAGQSAGPFMGSVPTPPGGGSPTWGAAYTYTGNANGTFSLTASGDSTTIAVPWRIPRRVAGTLVAFAPRPPFSHDCEYIGPHRVFGDRARARSRWSAARRLD